MSSIVGALFYLRITSLKNALIARIKRLKQPKYLIGGVVGVVYVYFAFYRRLRMGGARSSALGNTFPIDQLPMVVTLAALASMLFVVLCWVWPRARASLAFSEAEIAFLFPAPVSRSALIHYRLISMQGQLLFTSLIFAMVSSSWSFVLGSMAIRILGWWLLFATISLHIIGSSFAITQLLDRGITSLRRQLITVGIIVLLVAVNAFSVWRKLHELQSTDMVDLSTMANTLAAAFNADPLRWLLLPAKWVVRPVFSTDLHSFLTALGPALIVFAAHYVWVLRAEVSFEEASIIRAEKRAAKVAAMRQGKMRFGQATAKARSAPFNLSRVPRPELAFLWKNLLSSAEYLRPRTALTAAAIIVIGCNWLTRNANHEAIRFAVAVFSTISAGYVLLLGPLLARQDLRSDLLNADILKTYPLRGWQIVLGEILTPVAIITVLVWLMLLAASLTLPSQRMQWLTPTMHVSATIGIALLAPLLCAMQVLVLNAATVLFPAWMQTGQSRVAGIEVMGQRIFFFAGLIVVIVAALLPAAFVASAIYLIAQWLVGVPIAVVLAAIVVLIILSAEVCVATWWLGERFEKFDLSAELRP